MEVTHKRDPETGHYVQIVSAATLRRILDQDGETYDPPEYFGEDDEWVVELDPEAGEGAR